MNWYTKVLHISAIKSAELTDEQLRKINGFALRTLDANMVYARKYLLAHNMIDRDTERFPEPMLDDFARTFPGKSFLIGHQRGGPGKGLFFDAYTEEITPEDFKALTGEEPRLPDGIEKVKVLWAWPYVLKIPANEEAIANIEGGVWRHASIGFRAADIKRVEDDLERVLYWEYIPPGEALEGSVVWLGAQHGATAQKTAVPFSATEPADEGLSWDAGAAKKRIAKWASSDGSGNKDEMDWPKYRKGFAWYDSENAESFGSYKLPHHDIQNGKLVVVWKGVSAAMAALQGARGGVDIPSSDYDRTYSHLAKHYKQFDNEPPEKELKIPLLKKEGKDDTKKGGQEQMKDFIVKLSQKLGKVFTEDNALEEIKTLFDGKDQKIHELDAQIIEKDREAAEKDLKISELTPLAEEGRAYRKVLIDSFVTLKTKLEEIPADNKEKQTGARKVAEGFPVDFLKSEVVTLQARVDEKFPDISQVKGGSTEKGRRTDESAKKGSKLVPDDED